MIANAVLSAVPIYLLITYLDRGAEYFRLESRLIDTGMMLIEISIAVFILYLSFKAKRYLPALLVIVQSVIMLSLEVTAGHGMQIEHSLFVDKFSIIMALFIGIIGSAICLYAFGYMPEFHEHHTEVKDRRNYFGFLMYLFLSAMFGIVFSNNLLWLYFFWEITTLCSFLLIGYKDDKASRESAFRALNMNLIGGVVFAFGIVYPLFIHRDDGTGQAASARQGGGSAPRRLLRLCRPGEVGAISVLLMADRRHGRSHAGVGAAPFEHHGQGRGLSHPAGRTGHGEHRGGPDADPHRRGELPRHRTDRHLPEQRQKGARLFDHLQPRPDRRLCGGQYGLRRYGRRCC